MAGLPGREAQPFANMVAALGNGIAGMAINDKAVLTAGNQSNTERAVAARVSGAWTENAIASRYVTAERAGSRAHIVCVHDKHPLRNWWMWLRSADGRPPRRS
jgi:hypothetical protein